MIVEIPREVERLGAVRFGGLQKVFQFDSGMEDGDPMPTGTTQKIPYPDLHDIEKEMMIVIPVKNERLKLMEGVLCGIPHACDVIIVSNSPRMPVDRFNMEKDALENFCKFVGRRGFIIHQKDPAVSKAFERIDFPNILTRKGVVRDGKAEGMIIGTLLAYLMGKKYIGFIDADNYFPGAVNEYVHEYAAGFVLCNSPYSMVRIAWHSKPKIAETKLFFHKYGRTSQSTNLWLNKLIAHYTGYETEIIKTGNAGEHAMSMDLAMCLEYSAGYSIEPYHIINLIEMFGGIKESPVPEAMKRGVEVYQIESRNPHFHDAGDEDHVQDMSNMALQVICHSQVCPERLRTEILSEFVANGVAVKGREIPRPRKFPPLSSIDRASFFKVLKAENHAVCDFLQGKG